MFRQLSKIVLLLLTLVALAQPAASTPPVDQLTDLAGRASAIPTLKATITLPTAGGHDGILVA